MRSVIFHLIDVTPDKVAARLSAIATPTLSASWNFPRDSQSPVLYISLYNDLLMEAEPDELEELTASLGAMPAVSVAGDVSTSAAGDAEVRQLAALMLTEFRGVAWDDYTHHCWTLSEIQSGVKVEGHPFFDYNGWHRDRQNRPVT
jgi:hypothetical protein